MWCKRLAEVVLIVVGSALFLHSQTVIQHRSGTTENGTSVQVTLAGVSAGDWLIVDTSTSFAETITAPTDTAGDTYSLAANKLPGANSKAATYYAQARSSGAVTVTCNISGSADNVHCLVYEISGLVGSSPLDVKGSAQTSGNVISLSISTSAATTSKDYCHAFFANNNMPETFTTGNGWGHSDTTSNINGVYGDAGFSEDENISSGVKPTATATASNADQFTNLISCYKATASSCSVPAAFYVAANGNDNNPGTLAQPFLTMGKAQSAMQNSSTKITYLRAGTYQATGLALTCADNNETWSTYPCDAVQSASLVYNAAGAPIFQITGASGITITNFTFDGGSSGGVAWAGGVQTDSSSYIYVTSNKFKNNTKQSDIYIYNSDYIYFQANTSGPHEYQPISGHITDGNLHTGVVISDNQISNFSRMGFEMTVDSPNGAWQDTHIDRNTIGPYNHGTYPFAISLVYNPPYTGMTQCDTVWGNTINGTSGYGQWGIEMASPGPAGISVEQNNMLNVDAPIFISSATGSEIENNTLTNWGASSCAYNQDGGYDGTEWIGTNTLNGSQVTGDDGCLGQGAYGQQPAVCTPSTPYHH